MIINLTQHAATPAQVAAGVVEFPGQLAHLLNFDGLPTQAEVADKATRIALAASTAARGMGPACDPKTVVGATHALIGGAPYLMGPLERALRAVGITPLYAYSVRKSTETVQPDGTVVKTAVFEHGGFVEGGA